MPNRISNTRLDKIPEVCNRFEFSPSTFYKKISDGLFVPPVHLGERSSRVPRDEADLLMAAIIAGKSEAEIRELVTRLVALRGGSKEVRESFFNDEAEENVIKPKPQSKPSRVDSTGVQSDA